VSWGFWGLCVLELGLFVLVCVGLNCEELLLRGSMYMVLCYNVTD